MSKLTDKIEALMGDTSAYEDNAGHNEAPVDFRITRKAMLGILADVRELEAKADICATSARSAHNAFPDVIRQAKREAYLDAAQIAESLGNHGTGDCIRQAINALNTEGGDK